jgi:hypothetical protein
VRAASAPPKKPTQLKKQNHAAFSNANNSLHTKQILLSEFFSLAGMKLSATFREVDGLVLFLSAVT